MTDLAIIDDRTPKTMSWSKDINSIAFARLTTSSQGLVTDIYTVPAAGGDKTKVVESQWNDSSPAYSPDGTSLAFISDRSGANEIWLIDVETKQLSQLTGSAGKWVYDHPEGIEWSAAGDKILFTGNSEIFYTLYTVDVQ